MYRNPLAECMYKWETQQHLSLVGALVFLVQYTTKAYSSTQKYS